MLNDTIIKEIQCSPSYIDFTLLKIIPILFLFIKFILIKKMIINICYYGIYH